MPVMGGLDALEQLTPHCPVVMLTNKDDSATISRAMQNGASGYIVHGSLDPAAIANGLATCLAGGTITAGLPLTAFSNGPAREPALISYYQAGVTVAERVMLDAVGGGL